MLRLPTRWVGPATGVGHWPQPYPDVRVGINMTPDARSRQALVAAWTPRAHGPRSRRRVAHPNPRRSRCSGSSAVWFSWFSCSLPGSTIGATASTSPARPAILPGPRRRLRPQRRSTGPAEASPASSTCRHDSRFGVVPELPSPHRLPRAWCLNAHTSTSRRTVTMSPSWSPSALCTASRTGTM